MNNENYKKKERKKERKGEEREGITSSLVTLSINSLSINILDFFHKLWNAGTEAYKIKIIKSKNNINKIVVILSCSFHKIFLSPPSLPSINNNEKLTKTVLSTLIINANKANLNDSSPGITESWRTEG